MNTLMILEQLPPKGVKREQAILELGYEGANAVGKGRVLGRTVPYQVKQQRK